MQDWVASIEGTARAHQFALMFAMSAALLHAIFGALQKGRYDPWVIRGAISTCYVLLALPVALFIAPWPEPHMWLLFAGMFAIHFTYQMLQANAYALGAYTVVYPVVRGTSPLVTIIAAYFVFKESYTGIQWLGVLALLVGIFGLAIYNYVSATVDRAALLRALIFALLTGIMVAAYTTYDAYGIRATADPLTFLAWFFVLDGLAMPYFGWRRWRQITPRIPLAPMFRRAFIGTFVAFGSFSSIMMATRLDKVGEAAVIRETSVIFAAIIGVVFLKERVGLRQALLMGLIALGAVIVEMGG